MTPEVRAKQIQAAADEAGRQLAAIEAVLGLPGPDAPAVPTAPVGPDGKARKTLQTLRDIAARLAAIRSRVAAQPAGPDDIRRMNASFRGDTTPPPLRKGR